MPDANETPMRTVVATLLTWCVEEAEITPHELVVHGFRLTPRLSVTLRCGYCSRGHDLGDLYYDARPSIGA